MIRLKYLKEVKKVQLMNLLMFILDITNDTLTDSTSNSAILLFSLANYEASFYTYLIAQPMGIFLFKHLGVLMHKAWKNKKDSQRLPDHYMKIFEQGGEYPPYELVKAVL